MFSRHLKGVNSCFAVCIWITMAFITAQCGVDKQEFVSLEGKQFMWKGKPHYPIMVNYVVDFVDTQEGIVLSPGILYEDPQTYSYTHRDSLNIQLDAHLALIKEMGFNTVRLCFDRVSIDDTGVHFRTRTGGRLYLQSDLRRIHNLLDGFLKLADARGLKTMVLLRSPHEHPHLESFTKATLKKFKHRPEIMAYDLFNEPLYFDPLKLDKNGAYHTVSEWKKWMNTYAPHHLLTIGFAEPIEVFRWDPQVLPVDFISFHTYHPLRIPNEIYWYSTYIDKPWMLGETSLPSENDSISYEEQRQFLKEVYQWVKACGGSGFAWWEFQDEPLLPRHDAAFNGLLNNEGTSQVSGNPHTVRGTRKPAAHQLLKSIAQEPSLPCSCAVNYHNMVGYSNLVLEGRITDGSTGKAVEGALIRGWNEDWSVGLNTFSDAQGNFALYSNDHCTHFEISAPGMTLLQLDTAYQFTAIHDDVPPLDSLPNQLLEYHDIHYQPFLRAGSIPDTIDADHFIFDFDPSLFSKASYQSSMGTLKLMPFIPGDKPEKRKLLDKESGT